MTLIPVKQKQQQDDIPLPPGTKQTPIRKVVRTVSPKSNPALIVGIPKIISEMTGIEDGTVLKLYVEVNRETGKHRIILEKTYS